MPQGVRGRYAISTILILLLSSTSSLLGLSRGGHYTDPANMIPRIYAQDAVILVIAVPILALGFLYARGGSQRGKLVWLGSLAFMTYIWASYAFTIAFNSFFLGYVVLFSLSLFTLVDGVLDFDAHYFADTVAGRLNNRLYGGFLGVAALGLAALWLSEIIPATVSGTLPAGIEAFGAQSVHTYIIDLGVVVPSLAITAKWVLEGRPWGYSLAGVLLVFTALLAPAITAITVVDAMEGVSMSLGVVVGSIVPPLIGAVFAGSFLYAIGKPNSE